jgi:glutathione S-transferase
MMVLHGSGASPYVTRVLMQAAAKNLDLELRPANLADPEFRRMNPIGKMPVLEHDGLNSSTWTRLTRRQDALAPPRSRLWRRDLPIRPDP